MDQKYLDDLAKDHELWFKDNSQGSRLELRKVSLQGLDLSGFRLLDAVFEDVDLTKANLNGTNLIYSQMNEVILCEAQMREADLSKTDMRNVNFANADLTKIQMDGLINASNLTFDSALVDEGFFVKSTLTDCSFKNSSLKSANFKRAHFDKCSLQDANLESADFTRALLIDVDFRGCNIENTIFVGTRLRLIHVHNLIGQPAMVEDCGAERADFSEAGDNSDIRLIEDERLIFA